LRSKVETRPLPKETGKLASEIAAFPPRAVQGFKDVIRFVPENGVKAELEDVARKNAAILISGAPRAGARGTCGTA
jgi:hypothetical protein